MLGSFKGKAVPALLSEDSVLKFNCYKGISCFNACCKHADVTLAPYDVIRLQRHLGMSSEEFLKAHTVPFQLDADGEVVAGLPAHETGLPGMPGAPAQVDKLKHRNYADISELEKLEIVQALREKRRRDEERGRKPARAGPP